jgi:hypothetical protein
LATNTSFNRVTLFTVTARRSRSRRAHAKNALAGARPTP